MPVIRKNLEGDHFMKKILLATGNLHKVDEIKEILNEFKDAILSLKDISPLSKPIEDGKTYEENALKKALHYHKLTGLPTLADDSGLEIEALDGKPGIHSARFIDPNISFEERNHKVLDMLSEIPPNERKAKFVCVSVFVIDEENIIVEKGTLEGEIGTQIKGKYGFGYDPIFFLPNKGIYLAQIPPQEKNKISHRARAFKRMKAHIRRFLSSA